MIATSAHAQVVLSGPWQFQWVTEGSKIEQDKFSTSDIPCFSSNTAESESLLLRKELPIVAENKRVTIFVELMEQSFEASVNNVLVYSFDTGNKKNPGMPWHLFSIPEELQPTHIDFKVFPSGAQHRGFCKPLLAELRKAYISGL